MAARSLGPQFNRFWLAMGISGIGDGVSATAMPLLAAALTRDPVAVSAVVVAQWLPWLLFGLVAGALLDRWDRRGVLYLVDGFRLAIAGGLAVAVLLGLASIPLLVVVAFLLGAGRTLVDIAGQAVVPSMVSRDPTLLHRANGRLQATELLSAQFAGPPLGGVLFGLSAGLPFLVDAASFGASSALVSMIRTPGAATTKPAGPKPESTGPRAAVRQLRCDVAEGIRWLATNRLLRTMAALVAVLNLASAMCQAILVLFVQEKLGLGNLAFGVLLTTFAVGGAMGSLAAGRLFAAVGTGRASLGALFLVGAASIVMGLTSTPWVGGLVMAVNGFSTVVFNVVFGSLRQELVPDRLLGRVGGTILLLCFGAMPAGALLGGLLAQTVGLRGPFLISGGLVLLVALVATSTVTNKAIYRARAVVESSAA